MDWYLIPEIDIVDFISAIKPLYKCLEENSYKEDEKSEDKFMKTLLIAKYNWTNEDWINHESVRRKQKVLEMKMGEFHENIMGSFRNYNKLQIGNITSCDIEKIDKTELYEIKNKANTMNSDSRKSVYEKLNVIAKNGIKSYLVFINNWTKISQNNNFTIIDGKSCYHKMSTREDFYDDLMKTLHNVFTKYKSIKDLEVILHSVEEDWLSKIDLFDDL